MRVIKETFYLIKVGQLYVSCIEGEAYRTGFMGKDTQFDLSDVVLTPNLNEALLFSRDDEDYLDYCHVAAMMRTKVTKMEQVA